MFCSFIPPYLIRRLPDAEQHLVLDEPLRDRREHLRRAGAALIQGNSERVIHDAQHNETLPGTIVRREGDAATGDAATDEAYDWSGDTLALYKSAFARDSVDGQGGTLTVTVHYAQEYDNAFWDGTQLVFGDGDGKYFDRFTKPVDVLAHEFTHGVTQFTAGFTYSGQSGALNESISDVFGIMVKQSVEGETAADADWLIGEGIFLPSVSGKALRSMLEPGTAYDDPVIGKDPQVGSMADYVDTQDDNGGVHLNSGIPNRAFALAARGLGGHSWERAGQVWYSALTSSDVNASTDFAGFARATTAAASRLFADQPEVLEQVRAAWTTVGVLAGSASTDAAAGNASAGAPDPVAVDAGTAGGATGRATSDDPDDLE